MRSNSARCKEQLQTEWYLGGAAATLAEDDFIEAIDAFGDLERRTTLRRHG